MAAPADDERDQRSDVSVRDVRSPVEMMSRTSTTSIGQGPPTMQGNPSQATGYVLDFSSRRRTHNKPLMRPASVSLQFLRHCGDTAASIVLLALQLRKQGSSVSSYHTRIEAGINPYQYSTESQILQDRSQQQRQAGTPQPLTAVRSPSILVSPTSTSAEDTLKCAVPRSLWTPDAAAPRCEYQGCNAIFAPIDDVKSFGGWIISKTLYPARHHCRACGACICAAHSSATLPLAVSQTEMLAVLATPNSQTEATEYFTQQGGIRSRGAKKPSTESPRTQVVVARVCDACAVSLSFASRSPSTAIQLSLPSGAGKTPTAGFAAMELGPSRSTPDSTNAASAGSASSPASRSIGSSFASTSRLNQHSSLDTVATSEFQPGSVKSQSHALEGGDAKSPPKLCGAPSALSSALAKHPLDPRHRTVSAADDVSNTTTAATTLPSSYRWSTF